MSPGPLILASAGGVENILGPLLNCSARLPGAAFPHFLQSCFLASLERGPGWGICLRQGVFLEDLEDGFLVCPWGGGACGVCLEWKGSAQKEPVGAV